MKTNIKIVLLVLLVSFKTNAQVRSSIYSNLLNPFIYNPALAGSNDNIYAIFNTRGITGGVDGSNRSYNFGIHAPLNNNTMGIGAKVLSSSVGVFQATNAEAAYSKFVKMDEKSILKLGISMGITQTRLKNELLNTQTDLSDPALSSKDLNRFLFSSGIGLHYAYNKKAELGLSFPALMTGDKPLNNMMVVNASWCFNSSENNLKIKPMINYYKLNNSPNMADVLLQLNWKDQISAMGGYRSNGSAIASLGLNFKTFAINYAYYYQMSGIMALAPAQNEIAIAFSFNKPVPAKTN
ncbi:MAG: PorP/SprF family type IX secretion system membrane protein [Bacteroidota bacterium]|nr:PorP/SprF family type IX secretion system membrane protein [Bacteroidota bacterium]